MAMSQRTEAEITAYLLSLKPQERTKLMQEYPLLERLGNTYFNNLKESASREMASAFTMPFPASRQETN